MIMNRPIITNIAPSVATLAQLYFEADFIREVDEGRLGRAIENTSRWWCLHTEEPSDVIAIGRCITDWARYACVYDVIVRERDRRKGFGTYLMRQIIVDLVNHDIDTIHLWPSKGKVAFYERLGFIALSQEQPVMKLNRDLATKAMQVDDFSVIELSR